MPTTSFAIAALSFGIEQVIQWHFGAVGPVALGLISVGLKNKSPVCTGIGALMLALLVGSPGSW